MAQEITGYDRVSRYNHWVVAVLMIGLLASGLALDMFLADAAKGPVRNVHKAVGVIVLVLGVWRVGWRLMQGFAAPLHKDWQAKAAHWAHVILLVGIVVMPVSGVVMSYFGGHSIGVFGLFTIPAGPKIAVLNEIGGAVHSVMGKVMIATVLLHVVGAIKHVVIDRDGTMARMTRGV
ncbi:cytochrome b [Shimia haliotis]|uniref:Cytochrome b561 n=1 Tax=Shimia haliotis TaxID=1280847 RepID=A0A1I4AQ05_9RHOB|nr:cytochrome b [Shimia haliotis]SFK57736.1 cytochrome b561 [Shimia haliotis]